jgi:hypothetical protein
MLYLRGKLKIAEEERAINACPIEVPNCLKVRLFAGLVVIEFYYFMTLFSLSSIKLLHNNPRYQVWCVKFCFS